MLIDDDVTSHLRLWPGVEMGIKRVKYLKGNAEADQVVATVQYVQKRKQPRPTWENTFGHKGAKP